MMKVEVKLYSYHDMDLVGLYKTGKVSFPETTRQVLNSYARGEVYKVKLLHTNDKRLAKYPKTSFRKYYHYHVVLDGEEDSDAISLLRKITPGYRNNFIKVVLRQYLCGVFLEEYCVNGDTSFFNEMSRKFQGGRTEKEIRQTKKERDKCAQTELKDPAVTVRTSIESGNEGVKPELSMKSGNESGRAGELSKTASGGAKLKEKRKKEITDGTVNTDERSLRDNVKDENDSVITPRTDAGVVTRLKMNLRSPSPSPQGLTNDDEVGVQSVDGVSDSPCTSNDLRADGQPEVGRGLPSIDESGYVELPTEKHESEPADIAKNTGHNVLTSGKAKSIEPGSGDNNNKIKEDSFGLQDNKTMITSHTDEHPDIANSIKSYSDEDDFDEFLDEMTEQY